MGWNSNSEMLGGCFGILLQYHVGEFSKSGGVLTSTISKHIRSSFTPYDISNGPAYPIMPFPFPFHSNRIQIQNHKLKVGQYKRERTRISANKIKDICTTDILFLIQVTDCCHACICCLLLDIIPPFIAYFHQSNCRFH